MVGIEVPFAAKFDWFWKRALLQGYSPVTDRQLTYLQAFEEEFGVEIPDDAAEKIATVKDAFNRAEVQGD